jgi:C-terminal processing protease CtpA/Prc
MKKSQTALSFIALLAVATFARASTEPEPVKFPTAVARELVAKTILQVETHGLYPKSQADYDAAKKHLTAAVDTDDVEIDRRTVYQRIGVLLRTIDADNHSFMMTAKTSAALKRSLNPVAAMPTAMRVIDTANGTVLILSLPPIRTNESSSTSDYVRSMLKILEDNAEAKRACGLVVDLTQQTGGNAWPQMSVLEPLFGAENTARFVNREDKRYPVAQLRKMQAMHAESGAPTNFLDRFKAHKFGVIYGPRTSSAGEMIAIALMGEAGRTRTFGQPTSGMTTANSTYALPDNAVLALTTARYAIDKAAPIRGKLIPDVPAAVGESVDEIQSRAALWAAQQSTTCARNALTPLTS